jgi:hypothetical protein
MKRLIALIGLLLPSAASAISINGYGWSCAGFLHCGSSTDVVEIIATNIAVGITATIGSLAVISVLYGAVRMAASPVQEGKEAGKKAIIWGCIGLACALLSAGILAYVRAFVFAVAGS